MSNNGSCPKKMYDDGGGNYRFLVPGTNPVTQKKWFWGIVNRSARDDKSKCRVSKRQEARVYCHEGDVVGLVMRQCPLPWPIGEYDDVKTNVSYGLVRL